MAASLLPWLAWGAASVAAVAALVGLARSHRRREIARLAEALAAAARERFLVQPCPRCHEPEMRLLEVSPNARSLHYECLHCRKRMRAPASAPSAAEAGPLQERLRARLEVWERRHPGRPLEAEVLFCTPAAPLPYERTTRQPIPEAVRAEVWRRDRGCCVGCGGREQLEFDHIIPVSRGGASSARNLQLLCKGCNRSKGVSI